ncbi:MAG: proline iminopeptidase-family hydrolase [Candidatus Dormibacteria bacterium]
MTLPSREGSIDFDGFRTWFRIVGRPGVTGRVPLVMLHGGPGVPHDYLEPLEALADDGRQVVFYDQLGCGESDHPSDPSLFTIDLFVRELTILRETLGLDRVHLYGQSWGGMPALEYALTCPRGVISLVLHSSLASQPLWIAEANRLRADLPPDIQHTLLEHERAGTTADPRYEEAMLTFYNRHLCRLDPWPACLVRAFTKLQRDSLVYNTMWGPSEFFATGTLRGWDITARLGEIDVATLIMSGRHDEATPAVAGALHAGIGGSEWVVFEQSSHTCHLEETDRCLEVVRDFLHRVEARAPQPGEHQTTS